MDRLTVILDEDEDTGSIVLNNTETVGWISMICESDQVLETVLHYMAKYNVSAQNVEVDYIEED